MKAVRYSAYGATPVLTDAIGSPTTAVSSLRCLRPRGRHVQVGPLIGPDASPPLPMNPVVARELEIYGSHGMAARDYPALLSRVADRTLRPGLLPGTVIGLADAGQALADMDQPAPVAGMTVIDMEERAS